MDKSEIIQFCEKFAPTKKKKLDLSNKGITELPDELGDLSQLEEIDLSYNNIKQLPDSLFRLTNLKTILMTRNELETIPAAIGELKKLERLDISYNKLSFLPPEIGKLEKLASFDGSFNKLEELPLELVDLVSLKKLYLEDNPLTFPPVNVVKRGLYATMIFLSHLKKKRDATKIFLQIFNMPEPVQEAFEQYMNGFNKLVSDSLEYNIKFDFSYIQKPDKDQD